MKSKLQHQRPLFTALEPRLLLAALTDVPQLSSHPSSTAKLYLDFNGDAAQTWGSYNVPSTPAYSTDSDTSSFSASELTNISEIWKRVSEKYSPFNIDVTTIEPASFANKVALRVVIGGNGSWLGNYGGVSYVGSFYNSAPNVCFAFEDNLGNGTPKYVAEAAAHEAGHAFGLGHQKQYSSSGSLLNEYNPGNSAIAPTMGNSYYATRGLWFYGTSSSSTSYQDDMAILSNANNGFGYREDDYASVFSLSADSNGAVSSSGVIEKTTDSDSFTFSTGAGAISLAANVAQYGAMLNLKMTLKDADGNIIASADASSFGETLSTTVAAGTYTLVIASHGDYGDVGQYSLSGTLIPFITPQNNPEDNPDENPENPDNPQNPQPPAPETLQLSATAISTSRITLSWNDLSSETGYLIQRSANNTNWTTIASLGADAVSFTNMYLTQNTTWYYRVIALTELSTLAESSSASATTFKLTRPSAPSNFKTTPTKNRITFTWTDNSNNEKGFTLQRSINRIGWATIGIIPANYTRCSYYVLSKYKFYYRISAFNVAGKSGNAAITSPVKSLVYSVKSKTAKTSVFSTQPVSDLLK